MDNTTKSPPFIWRKTQRGAGVVAALLVAVVGGLFCLRYAAAQYQVPNSVMSSGGAAVGNSSFRVVGTLGQPAIGVMSSASSINRAGFWCGLEGLITRVEQSASTVPTEYRLEQNYPNPFNPTTTICFALPEGSAVTLVLVDVLGREVATLVDKELQPGEYKVVLDAKDLPTGLYFYRLQTKDRSGASGTRFCQTKRLLVLK